MNGSSDKRTAVAPVKHADNSRRIWLWAQRGFQVTLVSWLLLWTSALPLFHIHLDREHNRGLPHTVVTPSLPGEFDIPAHATSADMEGWHPSYPEMALTLLKDSSQEPDDERLTSQDAAKLTEDRLCPFCSVTSVHLVPILRPPTRVTLTLPSRAPPFRFV